MNALDEKTREVMTASYALPDLETAVQQVIYNAIDAHAKTIKLSVDVANASFVAVDDGDGIRPDDLYNYTGECYASSKLPISKRKDHKQQKPYGSRGAFLYELISLATTVEIESRVQEHWTSYRKVFEDGEVVFNARSKELREAPGTKVSVANLFGKLPVRRKDLSRNVKYRARVIQNIQNVCVGMSMIWPSLSFGIRFQGGEVRPVIIPAAKSCRERFVAHFGQLLGNELQYVSFSSETSPSSIRGYFAFIPGGCERLEQGIKQAKSYYQFAFLENEWVAECHQVCSRAITEAALEYSSAIPIFVLKVELPRDQYEVSGIGRKECVLFKAPDQLRHFLFEFVQKLAVAEENQVKIQELNRREVLPLPASSDQSAYDPDEELPSNDFDSALMGPSSFPDYMIPTLASQNTGYGALEHMDYLYNDIVVQDGHQVSCAIESCEMWASESPTMCQACGHINNASANTTMENTAFEGNDVNFLKNPNYSDAAAYSVSDASKSNILDFVCQDLAQEYAETDRREDDLEDIFFSNEPYSLLVKPSGKTSKVEEIVAPSMPWLSSKPDAYDCANVMLDLCDGNKGTNANRSGDGEHQIETGLDSQLGLSVLEQSCDNNNSHPSTDVGTKSDYFAVRTVERPTNGSLRRWLSSKVDPVNHLAIALQVDNVHVLKVDRAIKISKSTLAKLQVIRQVDRKFILVQADTSRGKLLLCIDQHAADERVRLEELEEEMFGHDGSLRQVEIHDHDPPLALQMNVKERETLQYHEELVKSWGFEFECISSKPKQAFVNASDSTEYHGEGRVLLFATPKVEKRAANADDFRDFIQLLSSAGETYLHSQIRPPVITRLLHSRACRSAIMFGDRLSLAQCRDLIEELKMCQLPFQCAHGRPSVVPLAEIHSDNFTNNSRSIV